MRFGRLFWVGILCFASVSFAAGSEARYRALLKEGERLYLAGKYHDAAEMLLKAYDVKQDHRVVYNIARALDQSGELQNSIKYYELYIDSPSGTDPTLLKRSNEAIERLKDVMTKAEAKAKAEADAKAKAEADAKAAEAKAQAQAEADRQARAEAEAQRRAKITAAIHSRSNRRLAAFASGGLGLLALGGGTYYGILARNNHTWFVAAPDLASKDRYMSATKSDALLADIGFGVGAVGVIAAVLLYPKGPEPTYDTQVSWIIVPGGIGLAGRF